MAALAAAYVGSFVAPLCAQQHLFKLLPADGAVLDEFGKSVAVSGGVGIVGAPGRADNGRHAGAAYFFDVATGAQIAMLLPSDGAAFDLFGFSVAISDSIAIVGAPHDDDNGPFSGSAYLFDVATGRQLAKLLPADGAAYDDFGEAVAISGAVAIVGAGGDSDRGAMSGSAYLFDVTTGQQLAKFVPSDGAAYDEFGEAVAISGAVAIIGASWDDDRGLDSGSAYLFDVATGTQIAKLLASDGARSDHFGTSVAISNGRAIVGANGAGSAYLFDVTTGTQTAKLLANDVASPFGVSVAITNGTALVGASVSAYLFDVATGAQIAKLLPSDGAPQDLFGRSGSISDGVAIVGAPWDDDNGEKSGSAYFFDAIVYNLHVLGSCPGVLRIKWSFATPGRQQGIVLGNNQGSTAIPKGACQGTVLGIQDSVQLVSTIGTGNGWGVVNGRVGALACGHYLQLVESISCDTSNIAQIP